jgi:hypothetical protein
MTDDLARSERNMAPNIIHNEKRKRNHLAVVILRAGAAVL